MAGLSVAQARHRSDAAYAVLAGQYMCCTTVRRVASCSEKDSHASGPSLMTTLKPGSKFSATSTTQQQRQQQQQQQQQQRHGALETACVQLQLLQPTALIHSHPPYPVA
jgi:hypothetical protein